MNISNMQTVQPISDSEMSKTKERRYFRPDFDDYFMTIAKIVSTRGTCDRLRVGAVLVKNKRIMATGYNGAPAGLPHCDGEEGHKMYEGHCIRTLHAEENAILQLAYFGGASIEGATLYTTYSPCYDCAKKIMSARIARVVCGKLFYRHTDDTFKDFEKAGVKVDIYQGPKPAWQEVLNNILKL